MSSNLSDNFCDEPESEDSLPRIYTVGEITRDIKVIFETAFDAVWIEGEISNYHVAASGHAYFVLKDEVSQISCVMFRHQRGKLKFDPEDGDKVLLFGRVTVYVARGNYQVIAETMEPRGLGSLQKAFEQLKEKLAKEGLFDESIKKLLPSVPWKIGIITSPTGAAIRDIIQVISRRNSRVSILLCPVRVQGEGSAQEIAQAIVEMNAFSDLDFLIIGRGGGSIEDLWAFNEECVARAIHASRLPVISAVGHEIDFTIADFVADVRAPTPSAAAEISVPLLVDIEDTLRSRTDDLIALASRNLAERKERLRQLADHRFFRDPIQIVQQPLQKLDETIQRFVRAPGLGLAIKKERFARVHQGLIQTSPLRILPYLIRRLKDSTHRLFLSPEQGLKIRRERFKNIIGRIFKIFPEKKLAMQRDQLRMIFRGFLRISPEKLLLPYEGKRVGFESRLIRQVEHLLNKQKYRLEGTTKNLDVLSPLNILQRGYGIAIHDGRAIRESSQVNPGDKIQVRLGKGQLDCTVDDAVE